MNKLESIKTLFTGVVVVAGLGLAAQVSAASITSMTSTIGVNSLNKIGKLKLVDRLTVTLSDGKTISTAADNNLKMALPILKGSGVSVDTNTSNTQGEPANIVWAFGPSPQDPNKISTLAFRITPNTGLVATTSNALITNPVLASVATSSVVTDSNVSVTTYPGPLALVYRGTVIGFYDPNTIVQSITVGL